MKFNKSMVDFVLDKQRFSETDAIAVFNITNYANFLSQKLELFMFVPAVFKDGKWVVLEEPINQKCGNCTSQIGYDCCNEIEYQTALSKVIFEGFELKKNKDESYTLYENENLKVFLIDSSLYFFYKFKSDWLEVSGINTIESILYFNLDIKESVAKELGLI